MTPSPKRRKAFSSKFVDTANTPYSGKSDEQLLVLAVNYCKQLLADAGELDIHPIREPYIAISKQTACAYDVTERHDCLRISPQQFKDRYILRRPDLMLYKGTIHTDSDVDRDHCNGLLGKFAGADDYLGCYLEPARTVLVEFDGAVHKTAAGKKHDDRRERDYDQANLSFISIQTTSRSYSWQHRIRNILNIMTKGNVPYYGAAREGTNNG